MRFIVVVSKVFVLAFLAGVGFGFGMQCSTGTTVAQRIEFPVQNAVMHIEPDRAAQSAPLPAHTPNAEFF